MTASDNSGADVSFFRDPFAAEFQGARDMGMGLNWEMGLAQQKQADNPNALLTVYKTFFWFSS